MASGNPPLCRDLIPPVCVPHRVFSSPPASLVCVASRVPQPSTRGEEASLKSERESPRRVKVKKGRPLKEDILNKLNKYCSVCQVCEKQNMIIF